MNLRERKKAKTREALARVAIRLFIERGFDATTIDEIAAGAGVSRRTFFRYYPSKEAVFFADQEARMARFDAMVDEALPAVGAWEAVRDALLHIAGEYLSDRVASLAWRSVLEQSPVLQAHDLRMDAIWEGKVRDALVRGGDDGFSASVRAGAMMGVVRAVLNLWYADGGRGDLASLGRTAFGLLEAGPLYTGRLA